MNKEVIQNRNILNFESFESKLGTWSPYFRKFIEGEEMWNIMQTIKKDSLQDKIVPLSRDTFRAFKTTNRNDLRVIFYLQDPYPRTYKGGIPQATGIAMDCSNSPDGKLQPSLELFYDALDESESLRTGQMVKVERSKSLEYLHEQGVMLLNTDLTCKANKSSSHENLWLPFQKYFLEEVMSAETHIIYVLAGKVSQRLKRYINPFVRIIEIEHPAAASHKGREWYYEGVFKKINNILKDNNLDTIYWNKEDWDNVKNLPF